MILYDIELNHALLFGDAVAHYDSYAFVRIVLGSASKLRLTGLHDLVNFTALYLPYRQHMQTDPLIARLFDQVRLKALTLDEAMPQMPE